MKEGFAPIPVYRLVSKEGSRFKDFFFRARARPPPARPPPADQRRPTADRTADRPLPHETIVGEVKIVSDISDFFPIVDGLKLTR